MSRVLANQLSLAPLGAGDLIDRAVRLYRHHFFTLIRIASPPVIVSAIGSVFFSLSSRKIFTTESDALLALYVLMFLAGIVVWFAGTVFSLVVMGGAARNLVTHLLWNEAVSARATYTAVRKRFWGLVAAALIVMMWLGVSIAIVIVALYMVAIFVVLAAVALAQVVPTWLSVIAGVVSGTVGLVLALWLLFFLIGRVIYVPQAMLVEGKGVMEAIGRSFSLARGNVRRLMAMALFISFATYSALMILIVPLLLYGQASGVNLSPAAQADWPAWYTIGYNVLWQASYILLAPVWMLGMSLLYVDERVRHEGYDVELMAARQLTEMPKLDVSSPLAPALEDKSRRPPPPPPAPVASGSVLGLS